MAYLGNLTNFNYKTSEWSIFKGRLTQFLKINSVKEDNKSGILLTFLTDDTYRLLRNLAYPSQLEALSFVELVQLLDGHFKPKECSFVDKANFYAASRSTGESLGDWAARLRGLASYCDFGTALEMSLRDRFVLGLGPGPERDKLFEQSPSTLTLSRAIELAEQAECAKNAKITMDTGDSAPIKDEPVYRAKFQYRGGGVSGSSGARLADSFRCSVCGMKNHNSDKCRYKEYKCLKCGIKGHLKKVCRNNRKTCVFHVDTENSGADDSKDTCEECQNYNIRYVTDKPIQINLLLGKENLTMELDSGSGRCVISENLYREKFCNYKLQRSNLKMCLYNGHRISPLGYFIVEAFYNKKINKIKIFVLRNGGPPLLGRDFMSAFNLIITTQLNSLTSDIELSELLQKFADLWRDELGTFNGFKVSLNLKDGTVPKFFKPRTVPFALKDKVEQELNRLVELGILVPVNYSQYATPIVPVLKDNGQVKIAGDFSVTLNKDLIIEKYPLPRIEEVFAKIGGGEHYSKNDLKNAYNQFFLDESSQNLTTINTHKGLYKYTRLVYGLANAPAIFQKSMETLLSGIDGVSIWLDDVCVTGPNRSIHMKRLTEVLSRLSDAGLRLEKNKCEFFKESVKYLGYVISKAGIRTCPDKVRAILDAPEPTNVTEVKRFLGMVNYYRNFIPGASTLLSPLHELLRNDVDWVWGDRQRQSVARVCRELASERVLAHFEPAARLALAVDAGPAGLGAVLSQRDRDGGERPLAYASRALTPSERNYSQIQKEATAIIFGVKHFHQYLYGRGEPFILKTDHRPLVSIFNSKAGIPVTTALRLQRYAIILSAYNYVVQYIPSHSNVPADYFSRAPLQCLPLEGTDGDIDSYYALNYLDASSPATTINEIAQVAEGDKIFKTVIRYVQRGWPRNVKSKAILPYFQIKSDLQLENGYLFRGHRIIIPTELRLKMLKELHESHLGIVKTKNNARSRMWWPGIDGDIERFIGSCETCVSVRAAPPRDPPAPWPAASRPWQRVHIDYMTVGQRVYLVLVDSHTKWLECIHMHNGTTTAAIIDKLKGIFSTFGLPELLVSDNDVKINSVEFKTFCDSNGIKYMTSPIYHPPSNGQAENSVRTCKKMLKCIIKDSLPICKIQEQLSGYLFNYRNTVHCTTGETPAKRMFGRNLRSRLDLVLPNKVDNNDLQIVPGKRYFEPGDTVWTRWYSARKETWKLGYIKEKIGNKMYKIFIQDFNDYCIRHVDQIIKYKGELRQKMAPQVHTLPPLGCQRDISVAVQPLPVHGCHRSIVEPASDLEPDGAPYKDSLEEDEWGDCDTGESEKGITAIELNPAPTSVAIPDPCHRDNGTKRASPQENIATQGPPDSSPTLTRHKRAKKNTDYKKYF